jgi:hypothetical protein
MASLRRHSDRHLDFCRHHQLRGFDRLNTFRLFLFDS